MNNPVAPVTKLDINGVSYSLLFDLESVALAEEMTDRPLLTGLRSKDLSTPTITLVRTMLFACLHTGHPQLPYDEVKKLITRKNLYEVWNAVLQAWTAGLAEPDEDAAVGESKDQS